MHSVQDIAHKDLVMDEWSYWYDILEKIKENDWLHFKTELNGRPKEFLEAGWWHAKYYSPEELPFDGSVPQQVAGTSFFEVPYQREFFYLSKGRFALQSHPVSYWSIDYETARIEATEELRAQLDLTLEDSISFVSKSIYVRFKETSKTASLVLTFGSEKIHFTKLYVEKAVKMMQQNCVNFYIQEIHRYIP